MDKFTRATKLHQILQLRRTPVPLADLCDRLECGERTVRRLIEDMRLYLQAPIVNQPKAGYFYEKGSKFELPGIWFTHQELQALLTIHHLTNHLLGGFFDGNIRLISEKTKKLLGMHLVTEVDMQRIRILGSGSRNKNLPLFSTVGSAVLERDRLNIQYESRQDGSMSEREVSPLRLVYYKGNWYMDVWCHQAGAFRTFAVEKITKALKNNKKCKEVSEQEIEEHFTTSFGIFAGKPTAIAVLHFSSHAAAWVQDEEWFPNLIGRWTKDNRFELRLPYNNPTELLMQIHKYGTEVEVIEPLSLRRRIKLDLEQTLEKYN